MFLKHYKSGDLAEVADVAQLFDPNASMLRIRYQAGEEIGDWLDEKKVDLRFASGEKLPACWLDPHYRVRF